MKQALSGSATRYSENRALLYHPRACTLTAVTNAITDVGGDGSGNGKSRGTAKTN
jgi:hypothetical protein